MSRNLTVTVRRKTLVFNEIAGVVTEAASFVEERHSWPACVASAFRREHPAAFVSAELEVVTEKRGGGWRGHAPASRRSHGRGDYATRRPAAAPSAPSGGGFDLGSLIGDAVKELKR